MKVSYPLKRQLTAVQLYKLSLMNDSDRVAFLLHRVEQSKPGGTKSGGFDYWKKVVDALKRHKRNQFSTEESLKIFGEKHGQGDPYKILKSILESRVLDQFELLVSTQRYFVKSNVTVLVQSELELAAQNSELAVWFCFQRRNEVELQYKTDFLAACAGIAGFEGRVVLVEPRSGHLYQPSANLDGTRMQIAALTAFVGSIWDSIEKAA